MTAELDLLDAVYRAPDDDAPRLAYADVIAGSSPDWAEFIRLQVARAEVERRARAPVGTPSAREAALLAANYAAWGHYIERYVRDAPVPRADDQGWLFDRGFVAFVRMEPENFAALGDELFAMAPIQHADLYGGDAGGARALLASPQLAKLDSLSLWRTGLDDDDAVALASCEFLRRATWLDLSDNQIGPRGVEALAASPILANKVVVDLRGNPCDPGDQPSYDWDGSLAWSYPSARADEIEAKLGRAVPWFHYLRLSQVPDRFHAKWYAPPTAER